MKGKGNTKEKIMLSVSIMASKIGFLSLSYFNSEVSEIMRNGSLGRMYRKEARASSQSKVLTTGILDEIACEVSRV